MKHFIPRLLNRLKLLDILSFNHTIRINNKRIKIPIIKNLGFGNWGTEELWMDILLQKLLILEKFNQFIDVGVNIGQTLIKVKSLRPDINYIGIEPSTTCVYYLKKLIKVNSFRNVSIINLALGSKEELLYLHGYSYEDSRATLRNSAIPSDKAVMKDLTPVYRFDALINYLNIEEKFVLKIDVEGEELNVILGAIDSIKKFRPVIICEILPHRNVKKEIERQKLLMNEIAKLNYLAYLILEDGNYVVANPLENLLELSASNYLFLYNDMK